MNSSDETVIEETALCDDYEVDMENTEKCVI
jgi:hypothetical protein